MSLNGRTVFILLLLCLWIYWAGSAFARGETGLAATYLGIGAALTVWRLKSARS
jgi:hypothetical protein